MSDYGGESLQHALPLITLETGRLRMRPWRADDSEGFHAINSEPNVQRFLSPLDRSGSDALLDRITAQFSANGWGFWALEEKKTSQLVGMCGIAPVIWAAPFGEAVELSWRLSSLWQGKGLAKEAASASIQFGLNILKLERLIAFTVPANNASWGLMERLGMRKLGYFDYDVLPEGHPLRQQVLYEITAQDRKSA